MSNWFTDLLAPFYYTDNEAADFAKNAALAWDNLARMASTMTASEYADLYAKIAAVYGMPGGTVAQTLSNARAKYNKQISAGVSEGFENAPDAIRNNFNKIGSNVWDSIPGFVKWGAALALALWALSIVGNFATARALTARQRERASTAAASK